MGTHHGQRPDLIDRILQGDEQAETEVVELYFNRLVSVAQKQLIPIPKQVGDAEGAVQSAFHSFFGRLRDGQFSHLEENDLWKLLVTITGRRAIRQLRHHFKASGMGGKIDYRADLAQVIGKGPSPEQFVSTVEDWKHRIQQLPNEELWQIATLKLEGYDNPEIAQKLQISERSVQRKLSIIRGELSCGAEK